MVGVRDGGREREEGEGGGREMIMLLSVMWYMIRGNSCDSKRVMTRGGSRILERGLFYMQAAGEGSARRYVGLISPRKVRKFFFLYFSAIRMGSRGTFVLCTASSRCEWIAGPGAAMCFRFLLKFRSHNVIRTYVHVNILDRGLAPKPFGFSEELQCNCS